MPAMQHLRSFADRIDRLDEEIKTVNGDKKEVYAEARAQGFDVARLKEAIKRRRKLENEPGKFEEDEALTEIYLNAITGRATEGDEGPGVSNDQETRESPVAPVSGRSGGHPEETGAIARVVREEVPHDPDTGEITGDDPGELPKFLDRRPQLVAAQ